MLFFLLFFCFLIVLFNFKLLIVLFFCGIINVLPKFCREGWSGVPNFMFIISYFNYFIFTLNTIFIALLCLLHTFIYRINFNIFILHINIH